jgi:hypothetical protein
VATGATSVSNLAALDSNVRRWLKGASPAAITVLLEAVQDGLESRGHALGTLSRPGTGKAGTESSSRKSGRRSGLGAGVVLAPRLTGHRPSLTAGGTSIAWIAGLPTRSE